MATMVYFLMSTRRKRKFEDNLTFYLDALQITTLKTLHGKHILSYAASDVLLGPSIRNRKEPDKRNHRWWVQGYQNWNETFQFILDSISDQIRKETTKFKEPTSLNCQLGLILYRLARGCSYGTVGDLFGMAPSTACSIFNRTVTKVIVQSLYDDLYGS